MYVDSSNGGGAVGIQIESAAYSHIINNIVAIMIGGRGADVSGTWSPNRDGGAAIGINLSGGLSKVWNNTVYDTRGGQSGQPNKPAGESVGLQVAEGATAAIINNALFSNTIGVSVTASNYLWDYNALWHNTLNYAGVFTGPHDVRREPLVVDPATGHLRLPFSSPLIDAGFDLGASEHDFEGNPRITDGNNDGLLRTDIGAYEYQPVPLDTVFLPIIRRPPP